jgi:hypothetical protein
MLLIIGQRQKWGGWCEMMNMATKPQIDYILTLLDELGYDPDDYKLDSMAYQEASNLIDELKSELGWS